MSNFLFSLIMHYPHTSYEPHLNSVLKKNSSNHLVISIQKKGGKEKPIKEYFNKKVVNLKMAVEQLFSMKLEDTTPCKKVWKLITPYGKFIWQSSDESYDIPKYIGFFPTPEVIFIKELFDNASLSIKSEIIGLHRIVMQITDVYNQAIFDYIKAYGFKNPNYINFIKMKRKNLIEIVDEIRIKTQTRIEERVLKLKSKTNLTITYPYRLLYESEIFDFESALELFTNSYTKSYEEIQALVNATTGIYTIHLNPSDIKIDVKMVE